jgi:hypothetical protein
MKSALCVITALLALGLSHDPASAFNCYVAGLQCEETASGTVLSFNATCDGSCNPCKLFVYRSGSTNCPQSETLIAKLSFTATSYTDTGGGTECRTYRVEVRRNCSGGDDGVGACDTSILSCGDCPCIP